MVDTIRDSKGLIQFNVSDLLTGYKRNNSSLASEAKASANWRDTEYFTQQAKSGHLQDEDY